MQDLLIQPNTQVEIINFQTFTTEYVAKRYGVDTSAITNHKRRHAEEIIDGVHFVYELVDTKGGKQEVLKWTLRGIIKLGMFIRSKEAKYFRLWAEQELEKTILSELAQAKETRQKNLSLVSQVSSLNALLIDNAKRHRREINGYKSQISQHNAVIASLKNELAEFKPKNGEPRYETLKTLLEHARKERDFYRKKSIKLENEKRDKELRTFRALQQTKEQLEHVYTAIGAVEAYVANDDRFFMEHNEILKG